MDYFHADRLNYAVVGTPNRLEYDQGFFVKLGDGAADLKPIAHLYKTQVYAMARALRLPDEICTATPTTDTYSLPQGQDEFYFALPYAQMDLALWALDHEVPADELAQAIGIAAAQASARLRGHRGQAARRGVSPRAARGHGTGRRAACRGAGDRRVMPIPGERWIRIRGQNFGGPVGLERLSASGAPGLAVGRSNCTSLACPQHRGLTIFSRRRPLLPAV